MKLSIFVSCFLLVSGFLFAKTFDYYQPQFHKNEKDMTWTCPKCGKTLTYPYSHTCEKD